MPNNWEIQGLHKESEVVVTTVEGRLPRAMNANVVQAWAQIDV